MFKLNVIYKNAEGETIQTDQRDIIVEFDLELTPEEIEAGEEAGKTVDDLVDEKLLGALAAGLAVEGVTPRAERGRYPKIIAGPAFSAPARVRENYESDEDAGGGPPLVEEG